ncbi:MAG TPA: hypothetical protein VNI84_08810 [Pyrinomonadaceae bacterium]|nr:hypothetical protein [Pyrinomonadaceae bacterium]
MRKIFYLTAVSTIALSAGIAPAQTTTGDNNAAITTRTTRPQTTPTPVSRVRPLSAEDQQRQQQSSERRRQAAASSDPDVLLDVPNLSVEEITLEVENLRAKVSLDARLANLLQLTAGADVGIDKVKLTIKGVKAEVLLKVRLDNVAAIIDRTLTTIDRNPQILERLLQSVDNTVGTVGGVANTALQPGGVVGQTLNNLTQPGGVLTQTVNTLGQTVQRTLDQTGNIVEKTLDTTGKVVNQRTIGSVLDTAATGLRVVGETTNNAGQTVRRLQDATGGIVEVTLDSAGKIVNSRIVQGVGGTRQRQQ